MRGSYVRILAACWLIGVPMAGTARADDGYRLVHSFVAYPGGYGPSKLVAHTEAGSSQWALYGTTFAGGSGDPGHGIVFKLTPPAAGSTHWTETRLYVFKGSSDGAGPLGGLIFDASGAAYGTTSDQFGSAATVYRLTPPSPGQYFWRKEILASSPYLEVTSLVMDANGHLYGAASPENRVYRFSPPASGHGRWTTTLIASINGNSGDRIGLNHDLAIDKFGALYGSYDSYFFGPPTATPTVFRIAPPAAGQTQWTYSDIYSIPDVYGPETALLIDAAGTIFGTTYGTCGAIFSLTPPHRGQSAWTPSFHPLESPGGCRPTGLSILDDTGAFFGWFNYQVNGILFRATPSGAGAWPVTVLHSFDTLTTTQLFFQAPSLIRAPDGVIYGSYFGQGAPKAGAVFKLLGQ